MRLLERLSHYARHQPKATAIVGDDMGLSYAELQTALNVLQIQLIQSGVSTLALDLDNGVAWALLDLAAMATGIRLVPLPPFFSPAQLHHALTEAGVDQVISDNPKRLQKRLEDLPLTHDRELKLCGQSLACLSIDLAQKDLPQDIAKITFTSGTTAEPKGVMLEWLQMERVVDALAEALDVLTDDRHVVLSPLAILLENIAGLYLPLWAGACVVLPSLSKTGLLGASGLDTRRMMQTLVESHATTAIFTPQMLQSTLNYLKTGGGFPQPLRFIALGGAAVSRRLLDQASQWNLPVYEGYGLSEFSSVVCLNRPGEVTQGSVGKPLKHVKLRIAEDGEVLISGNRFAGYLGESGQTAQACWWRSGDIGYLDDEGYLHLQGRRRHIFITAFGRNVSPEWVERELILEPSIEQAVVFGESRPWNCAVIVPADDALDTTLAIAVRRVNDQLPDYAHITQWLIADAPFSVQNGQLSGTGRLRREQIYNDYQERIDALYQEELIL
jgi:long-subunit acyl-CoA synthetase (AMP-forming)